MNKFIKHELKCYYVLNNIPIYYILFTLNNLTFNFIGSISKLENNKLIITIENNCSYKKFTRVNPVKVNITDDIVINVMGDIVIEVMDDIFINVIEYILNNNLGKFLYIDFKKNNTWKCYFEIIDNEILLQLI